ncbi:MAG: phosphoethanolamine--lipid A transferase, partial [Epsilonproteobacteria bacterium]|nr:phosphoethanolamine--lipid A transferase [Campylobacterota bacterium]
MQFRVTQSKLIAIVSLVFVVFYNYPFFSHTLAAFSCKTFLECLRIVSLGVILWSIINILLTLVSSRYTTKPIIIMLFMVSSFTTYFMNTYNVVIDDSMIRNALQTDIKESLGLFNSKLLLYILFLGLFPSYIVYRTKILYYDTLKEIRAKIKMIFFSLAFIMMSLFTFNKFYASFFREYKILRFYTNPTYWIYSVGWYIQDNLKNKNKVLKKIGLDAKIENDTTRKIVFMIVGEAARADHFSLNGYSRETNPKLSEEDIINFSKMYSCGTSTAHSVPCMFSIYTRKEYNYEKARYTENALDVLKHTNKVAILWRDNNSDSKGVALRVQHENYKNPKNNPICDTECRDIGMLVGLEEFIDTHKEKNILIVLHQMGNHGPEYYKRYTKDYKKFIPECQTNQLQECSKESISNAYDNALLYTDNFLYKTIQLAKKYTKADTAVLYMSDHGESLGENGIYLHGLPYFIAPDAQIHI